MTCVRRLVVLAALLSAVTMSGPRLHAQAAAAAPASDPDVMTAPVEVDGDVLFRVRGLSSFPAEVRAAAIAERIVAAAADPSVDPAALHTVEGNAALRIMAGDRPIMALVDADAALEGVSLSALATLNQQRIGMAIVQYRAARTPAALWRGGIRTAVATVTLGIVLVAAFWFWRMLERLLRRRVHARIHSVGIQSFEVVREDQIRSALESLFSAFKAVVTLAIVLVYAGYVLSAWPWTRPLSHDVAGFALQPLRTIGAGVVANIPRVVFLAVLFLLIRIVLRLIRVFFAEIGSGSVKLGGFEPEWAEPTYKLVRLGVVAFAVIVAYPYIPGSQSEAFKGVTVFIGIIFSLGSSSAISNTIAGYMMTYRRAFRLGDRVKIGDAIGEVIEMRLQVTHLRSPKNEEIVIPNSQILNGEVLNYSSLGRERGLLLHTEVGIGYETPWRQVEAMLLAAAARTPGLGSEPAPFVLARRLGDFAVVYELNVPCGDLNAMPAQYSALHHHILDVFNEHGVQIMTPAYEGDPPEPKIVPPKDWYTAPAAAPGGDPQPRNSGAALAVPAHQSNPTSKTL